MILRHLASLSTVLALAARVACAGEVLLIGPEEVPDPRRLAEILASDGRPAPQTRLRSLRLLDSAAPAPATAALAHVAKPTHSSFALSVQFSFDSARIANGATAQLDAVAEGIKVAGPRVVVVIEGHTDATGSAEYNLMLSFKRASAVKRYLVRTHGIPAHSLKVVGMGKSAPLDPSDPHAPENRRVEFHAEQA